MRTDVHAHAFPAAYVAELEGGAVDVGGVGGLGAGDAIDELDARLRLMDQASVDVQVLSTSALLADSSDPAAAGRAAAIGNEALSAIARRWPDRFRYFALLPLSSVEAAVAGLDDALGRPGCVGINIATSVHGRSIGSADFDPLFAELDRRSAVLFIHPAGRAAESELVRSLGFDWLVGATLEATIAVTHLIARGIPSRYPGLRLVNVQLGGALPMLLRRLENQFPRAVPDAPEGPPAAAQRMWFDTVSHGHAPALEAAAASFGTDRLVLGTDYPYVRGDRYAESVEYVGQAGLSTHDVAAVLGENAQRLLRLDGGQTA